MDIQNRNNKEIDSYYRKRLSESIGVRRIVRCAKNVYAKVILRQEIPIWCFIVHEVPTYPESIYEHLKDRNITDFKVMVKKEDESIEPRNEWGSFRDFGRLVFVVRK